MTLISSTIPLVPMQTMDGRTVYSKPGALGCPDCGGGCHDSLQGANEDIFASLQKYLMTAKAPLTFYSKPPGDWFPLVNNEITVESGRFLGSAVDYRVTDQSGLWLKANTVSPGWFMYDPAKLELKEKSSGVVLPADIKEQIVKNIFKSVPGGELAVKTGEVVNAGVETIGKTLDLTTAIVKNLPLIALGVGSLIVYAKYGDDIKKAFSTKSKAPTAPSFSGPKKRKRKPRVIHL